MSHGLRFVQCYIRVFFKVHKPDCQHCRALEECGAQMTDRLRELSEHSEEIEARHRKEAVAAV